MASEEKIGNMEEEALKRKERLKALKRKQDDQEKTDQNSSHGNLPKYVACELV